jgi:hypothetical protein
VPKLILGLLAAAFLLTVVGCGGNSPISISGLVTVDDQPLDRGKVDFEPADGKGTTAAAVIRDGRYQCMAMPGGKKIRITGGKVVGQHPFTPGNPASPMVEDIKSLVPARYNTETTLSCEIVRGTSSYDFKLQSRP